nr:hypothetical protein [Actinomycetota bacterium]
GRGGRSGSTGRAGNGGNGGDSAPGGDVIVRDGNNGRRNHGVGNQRGRGNEKHVTSTTTPFPF